MSVAGYNRTQQPILIFPASCRKLVTNALPAFISFFADCAGIHAFQYLATGFVRVRARHAKAAFSQKRLHLPEIKRKVARRNIVQHKPPYTGRIDNRSDRILFPAYASSSFICNRFPRVVVCVPRPYLSDNSPVLRFSEESSLFIRLDFPTPDCP